MRTKSNIKTKCKRNFKKNNLINDSRPVTLQLKE